MREWLADGGVPSPCPSVGLHHVAAPPLKFTGLGTVGPALLAAVGDDLAVTVRYAQPFFRLSSRDGACAVGAGAAGWVGVVSVGWDGAVAAGWGCAARDASGRVDDPAPCGRGGGSAARGAAGRPSAVHGIVSVLAVALAHRVPPPLLPSPPGAAHAPVRTSSTPATGLPACACTPPCLPAPCCCPGRRWMGRWSA